MTDNAYNKEAEEKNALRRKVMRELAGLSDASRERSDSRIFENLFSLPEYIGASSIFIFVGVGAEPNTRIAIERALGQGKRVSVPLCFDNGIMEARRIYSLNDLEKGRFGLPEPSADSEIVEKDRLDLIIAPALCYDSKGYRLGRGGGYYDTYLAGCGVFSAGLCRRGFLIPELPREHHDARVCAVTTEDGCLRMR